MYCIHIHIHVRTAASFTRGANDGGPVDWPPCRAEPRRAAREASQNSDRDSIEFGPIQFALDSIERLEEPSLAGARGKERGGGQRGCDVTSEDPDMYIRGFPPI